LYQAFQACFVQAGQTMARNALTSREGRRIGQNPLHRVMRVMLALSLWHAPIPWVHVHDLEGPQVEHLESLGRHVAEFHSRDIASGRSRLAWHAHLVLPWSLNHHLPCPDGDRRDPGRDDFVGIKSTPAGMNPAHAIGQPTTRAFLTGDVVVDMGLSMSGEAGAMAHSAAVGRGAHFFETYGRASAIRDLAGVRLC
jgi:hypothetical protein